MQRQYKRFDCRTYWFSSVVCNNFGGYASVTSSRLKCRTNALTFGQRKLSVSESLSSNLQNTGYIRMKIIKMRFVRILLLTCQEYIVVGRYQCWTILRKNCFFFVLDLDLFYFIKVVRARTEFGQVFLIWCTDST